MYAACRHIKANGLRCKSPALRGHAFCYHHVLARAASDLDRANLRLPVADDSASVRLAAAQIVNAMFAHRITAKEAGVALYAFQLSSHSLPESGRDPLDIVRAAINLGSENELAQPLCMRQASDLNGEDDCSRCGHRSNCIDYHPTEDNKRIDELEDAFMAKEVSSEDDESDETEDGVEETGDSPQEAEPARETNPEKPAPQNSSQEPNQPCVLPDIAACAEFVQPK